VARLLIDRGFRLVRPLAGGLEAWIEAGYAVEPEQLIAVREADAVEGRSPEEARR
jgi:3-mercaptopyruvate sulfurtransferase SseA